VEGGEPGEGGGGAGQAGVAGAGAAAADGHPAVGGELLGLGVEGDRLRRTAGRGVLVHRHGGRRDTRRSEHGGGDGESDPLHRAVRLLLVVEPWGAPPLVLPDSSASATNEVSRTIGT